jgi:PAS domain S-box-containing protein
MPVHDKVNILVVDDQPDKLLVLETVLVELGENIVLARGGAEALQHVLATEFAVILMDVEMPGMDGIEAAALIRRRRKSSRTPIIFVTAFADDLRTSQGYSLGAVDYMLSPVVPEILRTKVKVFVNLHRMTIEIRQHAEERIALAREHAAREVAERSAEALRRSEERFRLASEAVNGFIYEVDLPSGRFAASPGITELLGFSPAVSNSLNWWDERVHPDDLASLHTARQSIGDLDHSAYRRQYRVRHRDEHYVYVWDQGLVVQDAMGRACRLVGNVVDVTEHKRVEQELADANRRKDEFLSMLAHELRNPLAPIRNAVGLLRLQDAQYPNLRSVREVIDRNVSQLVRLVDDLLDVSRINHGKIRVHREVVDLRAVVDQAVEISMPLIESRSQQLSLPKMNEPIQVFGDLTRLTQVVANLLNNAAKYTEDGGQIWITLGGEQKHIVLSIRDSGVGLSSEMLERIFEPFTQAERSLDRAGGGLGIGLTLARRLVELHEGNLSAKSDGTGHGSEFIVRLPACLFPGTLLESGVDTAGAIGTDRGVRCTIESNCNKHLSSNPSVTWPRLMLNEPMPIRPISDQR